MKMFCYISLLVLLFSSCNKECDCSSDWDSSVTYQAGDFALHGGVCYKAHTQGGGAIVEPGTPGGDIWDVCSE